MLYWLLYLKLFHYFPPFRIFRYLTFRTAFASLTALFTGLIVGPAGHQPPARISDRPVHSRRRAEGASEKSGHAHHGRLADCDLHRCSDAAVGGPEQSVRLDCGFCTAAFAAIGFADDYMKVVHRRNLGLTGQAKIGLQVATSVLIAVALIAMQTRGLYSTELLVPFFKQFHPDLVVEPARAQSRTCGRWLFCRSWLLWCW